MDVDGDLDAQLLQQLRCMGTQDRDVLVADFKRLMGNELSDQCCTFYLDMANWNLQEAINAYCDYQQAGVNYSMTLIRDVTVGEGQEVSPNTKFYKTWRVKNTGREQWPPLCCLRLAQGEPMGATDRVMVSTLEPGQESDVVQELVSPPGCGLYQAQWRMSTPTGAFFGEPVWVIIQVTEDGLLGVTQQMSRIGAADGEDKGIGSPPPRAAYSNPFEKEGSAAVSNPFDLSRQTVSVPVRAAAEQLERLVPHQHAGSLPTEASGPLGLPMGPSRSDPDLSMAANPDAGEGFASAGYLTLPSPQASPSQPTHQMPLFGFSPVVNGSHLANDDDDDEML